MDNIKDMENSLREHIRYQHGSQSMKWETVKNFMEFTLNEIKELKKENKELREIFESYKGGK